MGMKVTCRYCKSKIEKKDALQIPGEKYNTYYCNQECYDKANTEKKAKEIERIAKKQEREEYAKERQSTMKSMKKRKLSSGMSFRAMAF